MTGAELREKFLEYFEDHGHTRVSSSSLIPVGDETLLFTNAGMVQFKNLFTGLEKRPYSRAVTAQKCLRVSGKHNDLENVGHTPRHHTFFEMLGNFSFGDYFKSDAIPFGWEFLTDTIGLPKKDMHITIYLDDDEAYEIWRKVTGFGPDRITRLGEKDNFWSMGDTGPCGPCSEIHIDQGPDFGCHDPDCAPGCDCDRYLELWNLVFMQYERADDGSMTPLPRPSIDTGLGLERIAAVVQGKGSNWESDLFLPIINRVEELSGRVCKDNDLDSVAIRVIADHSRAAAFLISDGILPSNEGRGYVLRRILRRALRYGKFIGLNEPFLYDTADSVVKRMGEAYPELVNNSDFIAKVIRTEEERFLETLARGLALFEEEAANIKKSRKKKKILPGDVVFRLYDTFGFPPDLTDDMARENGLLVDQAGFDKLMAKQKEMARKAREEVKGKSSEAFKELAEKQTMTEFTGYHTLEDSGVAQAIIKDGKLVHSAQKDDEIEIVTDRTPFYGESGGQVGDVGIITSNGAQATVVDTIKPFPDMVAHRAKLTSGALKTGDKVKLKVDPSLRISTMANHSATHILHWALREVLGDHVKQRGSLVAPTRLRFDFTHFSHISDEELARIEELVNDKIRANQGVEVQILSMDQAVKQGAIALFDEKYGDTVRMVAMGDFSKELCGGTHTGRTGDIGFFKIVSEGGIASGVRRIEALTGGEALRHVKNLEAEISEIAGCLRGTRGELISKLNKVFEEKKELEQEVEKLKSNLAGGGASDILEGTIEIDGVKVLSKEVDHISNPKDLRQYGDRVRDKLSSGVALLAARDGQKAFLLAIVTKDLSDRFKAGDLIKKAAAQVGGSGGGRPDMAQAGGPDPEGLPNALACAQEYVEEITGN